MGVSLARTPDVGDARPPADRRMMTGAMLLSLQAAGSARDLTSRARTAAPALIALCGMSRDDLERIAPIDWRMPEHVRKSRLHAALTVLVDTLYAAEPCTEADLRRQVVDVMQPLRTSLMEACSAWWYDDSTALAFADRLWEPRPTTRAGMLGSALSDAAMFTAAMITAIFVLPIMTSAAGDAKRREAMKALQAREGRGAATPSAGCPVDAFAVLGDEPLLSELRRARAALAAAVAADDREAIEADGGLVRLAARFREVCLHESPDLDLRLSTAETLKTVIAMMDRISNREGRRTLTLLAPVGDAALLADLERAATRMRLHVERTPADAKDAARTEGHLDDLAARFSSTVESGLAITPALRDGMVLAIRSLVTTMDGISSRTGLRAVQDLETGIRFVVSAHGSEADALSLPADRMTNVSG